jgi:hypothetical protein
MYYSMGKKKYIWENIIVGVSVRERGVLYFTVSVGDVSSSWLRFPTISFKCSTLKIK